MDYRVFILLILEGVFAVYLLKRAELLSSGRSIAVCAVLVTAALAVRAAGFETATSDYTDFLSKWVQYFRDNGGIRALSEPVGNYNIPYLYFLAAFSYIPINDLFLIKLLSTFFDILLACAVMRLAGKAGCGQKQQLASFFVVLFLPTVIINGSVWGQCDSIYVALALLAVYYALDEKPVRSVIFITLSFGFKLQAVFLMPIYAVLLFGGRLKWKHALVFPVTYCALMLPAVLLGRPFMETVTLYFDQAGSVGSALNYNSSSLFAPFYNIQNPELAAKLGIAAAFAFMLIILLVAFINRKRLSDRAILACAVLFAVGIPFLLPHMHDRYFFAADVLAIVMAFALPVTAPAIFLTQFASLLGYYAYFFGRFLLLMKYGTIALFFVLGLGLYFLLRELFMVGREADANGSI